MTQSVTSGGLQQSLCTSLLLCCRDGICPAKRFFQSSLSQPKNSLSCPAGANMNLFCFASRAQMKAYFSSAIYALEAPIPLCKAGLGFLSFTAFYIFPLFGVVLLALKTLFWTSVSFRKFRFSCRIDFIQHSCCREC